MQLPSILQLPMRDLDVAVASSLINFLILLGALIVVLAIIAAIDFFYQRHAHIESLKMTKQEVKDEYKQTEGSPEVKAKIRRMQMKQLQMARASLRRLMMCQMQQLLSLTRHILRLP